MWLSSFPNTIYWRDCPFPILYSWLLCHKLIDRIRVGWYLGFLFCSVDLYICFYTTVELLNTFITSQSCFIWVCVCVCVCGENTKVNFCIWCEMWVRVCFFPPKRISICSSTIFKKDFSFPPLNHFGTFVINQLSICVQMCFWILYSVPLIYVSVLRSIPRCLIIVALK